MAVARTSTGSLFSSAASGTATFAAGATAGDLGILIVETANQTITTPTGWTGPVATGTGTAGAAAATMLQIFYRASITSGEVSGGIAISDSGDHQNAVLLTYSGHNTSGPINTSAVTTITPASTSASCSAITVNTSDVFLAVIATDRDSATVSTNTSAAWSNVTGSNSFIENLSSATAAGGGIIVNELIPTSANPSIFTCSVTSTIMVTCAVQIVAATPAPFFNRQARLAYMML